MHQPPSPNAVFGYKFRVIYYSLILLMLILAVVDAWWMYKNIHYVCALYFSPSIYVSLTCLTVFNTLALLGYIVMLTMIPIKAVRFLHCFYEEIGEEPPKPLPSLRKAVVMFLIPFLNFLWFFRLLYNLNFLLNYSFLYRPFRKSNRVASGTFMIFALFFVLASVFALICCYIIYRVYADPPRGDRLMTGLVAQFYVLIFGFISLLFFSSGLLTFHIITNSIIRMCNDLQSNGVAVPSVIKPVLVCTMTVALVLLISAAIFQFCHSNRPKKMPNPPITLQNNQEFS